MSEKTCGHKYEAKFGCPECVAKVRAGYPEFPLQSSRNAPPGPASVPWVVAEKAWAAYSARYGRDQSVERLAQRGGLGWCEMDDLFPGWREATDEWAKLRRELASEREARERAEAERDEQFAHLHGHTSFIGPCDHGRDPWTRCETCSEGNAVAAVLLLLRQAERERDALAEAFKGAAPDTYEAVVEALVECMNDGPRMAMAKHARQMETRAREEKVARERAETDNAELVEQKAALADALRSFFPEERHEWSLLYHHDTCALLHDEEVECSCGGTEQGRLVDAARAVLRNKVDHPGAAVLEELRALRKVREALGARVLSGNLMRLVYEGREKEALRTSCAGADALMGKG